MKFYKYKDAVRLQYTKPWTSLAASKYDLTVYFKKDRKAIYMEPCLECGKES